MSDPARFFGSGKIEQRIVRVEAERIIIFFHEISCCKMPCGQKGSISSRRFTGGRCGNVGVHVATGMAFRLNFFPCFLDGDGLGQIDDGTAGQSQCLEGGVFQFPAGEGAVDDLAGGQVEFDNAQVTVPEFFGDGFQQKAVRIRRGGKSFGRQCLGQPEQAAQGPVRRAGERIGQSFCPGCRFCTRRFSGRFSRPAVSDRNTD